MAEYIEREALLNKLCSNDPSNMEDYYYNAIIAAPAADVRPVVLCKDCKHWEKGDFQGGNDIEHLEWGGSCEYVRFVRFESGFCSYGERK